MDPKLTYLLHSNCAPTVTQTLEIRRLLESSEVSQLRDLAVHPDELPGLLRYLRGTLSLIRTFPAELLSQVFIFCRDNSHALRYSTIDPREAPMILGHVCRHWRSVAYSTPRLWDTVSLSNFASPDLPLDPSIVHDILAHSRDLPLELSLAYEMKPESLSDAFAYFDTLWASHERLRTLTLNLSNTKSNILPCGKVFHVLSSIDIKINYPYSETLDNWENMHYATLSDTLEGFSSAPALRSLRLEADFTPEDILIPTLPWSQLTHLELFTHAEYNLGRDIIIECPALEEVALGYYFGPGAELPLHTHYLRTLSLDMFGEGPDVVLLAFVLPRLESLTLRTEVPVHAMSALVALYERSRFSLVHLELGMDLPPEDVGLLLRIFCSLRTLSISGGHSITNRHFTLFNIPSRPIRHPRLQSLTIGLLTFDLDGAVVAEMAETLAPGAARIDAPFPALRELRLPRAAPEHMRPVFSEDVEARLETLRATGFLDDSIESW
ncbi:hypothetical protein B0H15DRAFT_861001 [Mycena belliarum]|uniref:F-box domain-containing protein n=1 Tax=Mycena belliarum TaxID=1033014 RepID=A0AAD6TST5_9AGAR|nr:hypothetical protein B0H15DRAFT_861001 [Mycena belliae]